VSSEELPALGCTSDKLGAPGALGFIPVELLANSTPRKTGRLFDTPVLTSFVTCAFVSTVKFGRVRIFWRYALLESLRVPFRMVDCVHPTPIGLPEFMSCR
jgi:hypothetical protein